MTKSELEDVKKYLENYKSLGNYFRKYSRLYSSTTENISGFLRRYDLKDKKVLTVAGSGDQRLNALLFGAKQVTCFDINPLAELQLKLKDEVIKKVELNDYLHFFGVQEDPHVRDYELLNNKVFNQVKDYLDENTFDFFNYVINQSIYIQPKDIYFNIGDSIDDLKKMNNYMTKEKYKKLRKILFNKKLDFICTDVTNIKEHIKDEKYDMILLSNISDYIHHMYPFDDIREYRLLIDSLMDNLNEYGTIQVGYIYSLYGRGEDISDFHLSNERKKFFPTKDFKSTFVDSYYNDGTYDKIITYQKVL